MLVVALCVSCTPSDDAASSAPVPVSIHLDHAFNGQPFALGTDYPGPGDAPLRVTRLTYYLGQFRLQHEDGRWFSSTRSAEASGHYQLVDAAQPSSLQFDALSVPPGRYKTLEFLVGVAEADSGAGAQTGALDPAGGMFWTWKSGYIFFALEGRSAASGGPEGAITFHLGGSARLVRTLVLPLAPDAMVVKAGDTPVVQLRVDVGRFFDGLPLSTTHTVMAPAGAEGLADRYAGLFSIDRAVRGPKPS